MKMTLIISIINLKKNITQATDNIENHYNENTTYEYYKDSKDVDISNEDDTYNINHQSKEEHHTSD